MWFEFAPNQFINLTNVLRADVGSGSTLGGRVTVRLIDFDNRIHEIFMLPPKRLALFDMLRERGSV
jgi:hypothetical protein